MLKIVFLVFGIAAMHIQYCSAQEKIVIKLYKKGAIDLKTEDIYAVITNAYLMSNPLYTDLGKAFIQFKENMNDPPRPLIEADFPPGTFYRYTKIDGKKEIGQAKPVYNIETCSMKFSDYIFKSALTKFGIVSTTVNFTLHFIENGKPLTLIGNIGAPIMLLKNEFVVDKDDNPGMDIADVAMAYRGMIGKQFTSTYNGTLDAPTFAGMIETVTMRKNRGNEPYLVIGCSEYTVTPGGGDGTRHVVAESYPGEKCVSMPTAPYNDLYAESSISVFEEVTRQFFAALQGPFPTNAANTNNQKKEVRITSVTLTGNAKNFTVGRCIG